MKIQLSAWAAAALVSIIQPDHATLRLASSVTIAASEVYIEQARGRVAPGKNIETRPTPETATTTTTSVPAAEATAPVTCNAQNASSQACYTASQQARPAGR